MANGRSKIHDYGTLIIICIFRHEQHSDNSNSNRGSFFTVNNRALARLRKT